MNQLACCRFTTGLQTKLSSLFKQQEFCLRAGYLCSSGGGWKGALIKKPHATCTGFLISQIIPESGDFQPDQSFRQAIGAGSLA